MSVSTGANTNGHYIRGSRFDLPKIVVIFRAAGLWPLNEMKEVFMTQSQPVRFRPRWDVRLVPDNVVSEDPALLLHCDGKTSRDQKKLLFLPITSHRSATAFACLVTQTLATVITNARPSGEIGVANIYPQTPRSFQAVSGFLE